MAYEAELKRISRELSDDIDEWHKAINHVLEPRRIRISKEDASAVISYKLRLNGGPQQLNLFFSENHRRNLTHKLEPDLLNMDLKQFMDMQVSDLIKILNRGKV